MAIKYLTENWFSVIWLSLSINNGPKRSGRSKSTTGWVYLILLLNISVCKLNAITLDLITSSQRIMLPWTHLKLYRLFNPASCCHLAGRVAQWLAPRKWATGDTPGSPVEKEHRKKYKLVIYLSGRWTSVRWISPLSLTPLFSQKVQYLPYSALLKIL